MEYVTRSENNIEFVLQGTNIGGTHDIGNPPGNFPSTASAFDTADWLEFERRVREIQAGTAPAATPLQRLNNAAFELLYRQLLMTLDAREHMFFTPAFAQSSQLRTQVGSLMGDILETAVGGSPMTGDALTNFIRNRFNQAYNLVRG
jgi:hypothetical protein